MQRSIRMQRLLQIGVEIMTLAQTRKSSNNGNSGTGRLFPGPRSFSFAPRMQSGCIAAFWVIFLYASAGPMLSAQTEPKRISTPGMPPPIALADALHATLQHHPALQIQHLEVIVARAQKQEASSQFDTTYGSNLGRQSLTTPLSRLAQRQLPAGIQTSDADQSITAYGFNFARQFRNGVSVNTFTSINRAADNIANRTGLNTSQSGVQLVLPLLQGRGRDVVGAKERAAGLETSSRELDARRVAEELLAKTAVSYWNLVAARQTLTVAVDSERRSKVLLDTVNALIESDQRPRVDIYEVKATLASRVADRIAAQQALGQARKQLALDMGLPASEILTVGDPADDFPAVSADIKSIDGEILQRYVTVALQNRPDAIAARERIVQTNVLLHAAQKMTKPLVNLQFTTGYAQLSEGGAFSNFLGSWFSTLHRPDLQTGLVFQFPGGNNLAQGQKLEAQAKNQEAELQLSLLTRSITGAVAIAAESVQDSALRLENTREAVAAFQQTLEGAREKYRLGEVSLTELLTVEDRLTAALSNNVRAEFDYAVALADLRLASGTLLTSAGPASVDPAVFSTLPNVASGKNE